MSFDDDPDDYQDGWYEEPDDTDWDDQEEDHEDKWVDWEDDVVPVVEERDCPSCYDNGCRSCEPTRLDILRWRLSSWFRLQLAKLRRHRANVFDEPPF